MRAESLEIYDFIKARTKMIRRRTKSHRVVAKVRLLMVCSRSDDGERESTFRWPFQEP